MKLYKIEDSGLKQVRINPFKLEKEIQNLVEENVATLFNLEFVRSELKVGSFRLDTLCFDVENNSFVIIEYKRGVNYSVIDQGYTYLSLMLNNKSDFILEYNETLEKNIKRDEVDWSQSKVIFISPKFSDFQIHSINFKSLPFELWEITRYSDDSLALNHITTESDVDIGATVIDDQKDNVIKSVSKEIKRYDEEYHLYKSKNRPERIVELYHRLKERILDLGEDIELKYNKQYISFRNNRIFTDLIIYDKGIIVMINMKKGKLKDSLGIAQDVSNKGHWGNGDYRISLKKEDDFEYVVSLIKQSYLH